MGAASVHCDGADTAAALVGHDHRIDDVNDAVLLVDVGNAMAAFMPFSSRSHNLPPSHTIHNYRR